MGLGGWISDKIADATKAVSPPSPPTLKADEVNEGPPLVLNPDYQPSSNEEAKTNLALAQERQRDYVASLHDQGVPTKMVSGVLHVWQEDESENLKPQGMSDEDWALISGDEGGGSGKWVPDVTWQQFEDDVSYAEDLAKELKGSGGAAKAALSIEKMEENKSDEITRQYKDFAARAGLLYDLMEEEQDYAMAADDQNIANWKAQKDLGMATNPGGYYGTPYQSMTMSEILRPSLPDYVRPDYRLNESVGLPGPQGFDDPDYTPYGLPMFSMGTDPIPPPTPPGLWPWKPRL